MLCGRSNSLLRAASSAAKCLTRSASQSTHYLQRGKMSAVAYRHIPGENPGVIFLPGFQSNMQGVKALALESYCKERGLAFTRFDYQGCGESTGDLRKILFSDWKEDVLTVLDTITAGQQILVGSSMGAWLAILVALERHHRIHSIIGLSTAPDISQRALQETSPEMEQQLAEHGECILQTEWGHYVITQHFLDEIESHFIMNREKIPITCPVRFIHGMRDTYVPYQNSINLANKIQSDKVLVLLRKKGDHRLSQPDDIQLLFEELDYAIKGSDEARQMAIESWASFSVYSHPEHMIKDRRSMKEHKIVKAMK